MSKKPIQSDMDLDLNQQRATERGLPMMNNTQGSILLTLLTGPNGEPATIPEEYSMGNTITESGFRGNFVDLVGPDGKIFYNVKLDTGSEGVISGFHQNQLFKIDFHNMTNYDDLPPVVNGYLYSARPIAHSGRFRAHPDPKSPRNIGNNQIYDPNKPVSAGDSAKTTWDNYKKAGKYGSLYITSPNSPDDDILTKDQTHQVSPTAAVIVDPQNIVVQTPNGGGLKINDDGTDCYGKFRITDPTPQQPIPIAGVDSKQNPLANMIPSTVLTPLNPLIPNIRAIINVASFAKDIIDIAKDVQKLL